MNIQESFCDYYNTNLDKLQKHFFDLFSVTDVTKTIHSYIIILKFQLRSNFHMHVLK